MHRDQRHDQTVLLPQCHNDRCQQGRHNDIVRRCRQPHPKDQRQDRGQEQDRKDIAARQNLDHIGKRRPNAGLADHAHDDTGGRRGDTDTDHVARPDNQAVDQVTHPRDHIIGKLAFAPENRHQRALCHEDKDHVGRGPERRQARGQTIHHQGPDQHDNRQDKVQARPHRWTGQGQTRHRLVRIIQYQRLFLRPDIQQTGIDRGQQGKDDIARAVGESRAQPAHAIVDSKAQRADTGDDKGGHQQALHNRLGRIGAFQPDHTGLQRFEVHNIHQRDVRDHRGQKRVFHHIKIGDAHIFNHQESCGPHDGRHDLTVDRRRNLDRAGLFRAEPHLFHQRNGKCPRGHDVGDG